MILHLDMDAFFAAVEQMDNPSLRGQPVIIGGGQRGVVSTASYEARKYGIHSAMPMATARKLCPHGVFIRGNGRRYCELSAIIMNCLRQFSPLVQPASIDEAYVDIGGVERLWGSPLDVALKIKKSVAEATGGLTCSTGIAPIKFLAKICSDVNKPDGVCIVQPWEMDDFLLSLPVEKLPGVGNKMREKLLSFGIAQVSQLRQLSRNFMVSRFGKWGGVLHDRAHGIDPGVVHENPPPRSEGAECTFSEDISDTRQLQKALLQHADRVGQRLRRHGEAGRTVTLKIKFSDFRQITRARTLEARTNATAIIFSTACNLLSEVHLDRAVRLIGISVSGFDSRPEQLFLPSCGVSSYPGNSGIAQDSPDRERQLLNLDQTMDALRARFGRHIIQRASIFSPPQDRDIHHFG